MNHIQSLVRVVGVGNPMIQPYHYLCGDIEREHDRVTEGLDDRGVGRGLISCVLFA